MLNVHFIACHVENKLVIIIIIIININSLVLSIIVTPALKKISPPKIPIWETNRVGK